MTQPREILFASKLFQDLLTALKERALLQTHNQAQAMVRAILLGLRRHMTTEQVLRFADALDPLPRGIFIEGWRPGAPAPLISSAAFVREVTESLAPHHVPPDSIVADVFAVLSDSVGPVRAEVMRAQLPHSLQPLWPEGGAS